MISAARVASAVLAVALSFAPRVDAASLQSLQVVRLEPVRMFDRGAESIFASLGPQARSNLVGAVVFNVASSSDALARAGIASVRGDFAARSVRLAVPMAAPQFSVRSELPGAAIQPPDVAAGQDQPNIAAAADRPIEATAAEVRSPDGVSSLPDSSAPVHFGAYQPYVPTFSGASLSVPVPTFGAVRLEADAFRTMSACGTTDEAAPCAYLANAGAERLVARSGLSVRAGNDRLRLEFSGSVERLSAAQTATFPYVPLNPDPQYDPARLAPADPQAPMLSYPGVSNLVKHGLGASLAVPVTRQLTIGLQYESQHYQGSYVGLGDLGLNARKDTYLGGLTYQLPNSSSAITLSAGQNRYQDALSPDFNLTQTRADLNFTVKF